MQQQTGPPKAGGREPMWLVNQVKVEECGEAMVSLAKHCPWANLEKCRHPWARQRVVEMLSDARTRLPEGYTFRVFEAYRTLEEQAEKYWNHYAKLKQEHPNWPENILRRNLNRFLAPPDAKAPPGHSTGGAIDLRLIGPSGEDVDMTSTTAPGVWPVHTYSKAITPEARANRRILIDAMAGAGFSNCLEEWWHWSYGDSPWAARVGAAIAFYGRAEEGKVPWER